MALAFLHAATQAPQPMHSAASIAASASSFDDRQSVRVLRGAGAHADEAAGDHDAVKGAAVHGQILDDGEGLRAEGLDPDGVAVLELPHVKLAGRRRRVAGRAGCR